MWLTLKTTSLAILLRINNSNIELFLVFGQINSFTHPHCVRVPSWSLIRSVCHQVISQIKRKWNLQVAQYRPRASSFTAATTVTVRALSAFSRSFDLIILAGSNHEPLTPKKTRREFFLSQHSNSILRFVRLEFILLASERKLLLNFNRIKENLISGAMVRKVCGLCNPWALEPSVLHNDRTGGARSAMKFAMLHIWAAKRMLRMSLWNSFYEPALRLSLRYLCIRVIERELLQL
jgi:hypothetical protein